MREQYEAVEAFDADEPDNMEQAALAGSPALPSSESSPDGAGLKSRQPKWQPKKKPRKKRMLLLAIVLLLLLVGGYFLYQLFFAEEEQLTLTAFTSYGSLNRAIEGSGTTQPVETQTVTLASMDADILNIYVQEGDEVQEGDILYEQDDSAVDDLILDYESQINELQIELNDFYSQLSEAQESQANLTVTAPFSGRLSEITVELGDDIMKGSKLAAITNDSSLRLTQYVSYAYQGMVELGMPAYVSIADQMLELIGTVTDLSYTNYISGDGTKCFTVEILVENPGSLSAGMTAASYFVYGDQEIYPVSQGQLENGDYSLLNAGASGTIQSMNVRDYQQVSAGQVLFVIDSDDYEKQSQTLRSSIENTEKKIEDLREKIEEAEESRSDYIVKADISGTVMEMNLQTGTPDRFMAMQNAITIYNLDVMTISVNIDELDIDYLSEGMSVTVIRSSAEQVSTYEAEISYISFQATENSGVSTFPVTIEIDSQGALSAGVNVSYSVNVGDSSESVLAPVEAIRSTSQGNCLFVKADEKPENAVTLDGEDDPEVPSGFYAVPVEVGSTNSIYIRILSGVEEDTEVFTRYQQSAPSGGDRTSQDLEGEEGEFGFPGGMEMPDGMEFPGGFPGGGGGMGSSFPNGGGGGGMPGMGR